jgi:hypothetical protein
VRPLDRRGGHQGARGRGNPLMGPADQAGARAMQRPFGRQWLALAGAEDVERLQFPRPRCARSFQVRKADWNTEPRFFLSKEGERPGFLAEDRPSKPSDKKPPGGSRRIIRPLNACVRPQVSRRRCPGINPATCMTHSGARRPVLLLFSTTKAKEEVQNRRKVGCRRILKRR